MAESNNQASTRNVSDAETQSSGPNVNERHNQVQGCLLGWFNQHFGGLALISQDTLKTSTCYDKIPTQRALTVL